MSGFNEILGGSVSKDGKLSAIYLLNKHMFICLSFNYLRV